MAYWGSSWLQSFVHHRVQGEVPAHSCEGQRFKQRDPGLPDCVGQIHAVQDDEYHEGDHKHEHNQWPHIGCEPCPLAVCLPPGCDLLLQLFALIHHGQEVLLVFRAQLIILVQDALEHTKATLIWEEASNCIKKVRIFAFQPMALGTLP